jgi:endonuclease/exonuclease/phosphatase family metal-dependent hydrolase
VILSWNVSSSQTSAIAPNPQLRAAEAPRLVREEILRSQPDIIALQGTLCPLYGKNHYLSSGYVSMGSQTAWVSKKYASLDGTYIDLLIKRQLGNDARRISFQTFEMHELPAVAAIITLPNRTRIAVASLHLPHTKEAAPARKRLCNAIMEQLATQQCEGIILAGCFNMRKFEDNDTEKLCGGNWKDAWKEVTRSNSTKEFTWDGRENLYRGLGSFPFYCRFDRCYVRGDKLRLWHFDLIGNQPVDGKEGDYLSDHYGIVVKCDIGSTGSSSNNSFLIVNSAQDAAAIRAARLQRFACAAPAVSNANPSEEIKSKSRQRVSDTSAGDFLIDLSKDSEDENDDGKRSSSSRGQYNSNGHNNMVDLTEDSDDEVQVLERAAASDDVGVSVYAHQNDTAIASTRVQSGATTLISFNNEGALFSPDNNDENDSHAGNSQSEYAFAHNNKTDEDEVSKMSVMNSSESDSGNNQSGEGSDFEVDDNIIETSAINSNTPSPSLSYASSNASTPIRDNRALKPASKKEAANTKNMKRYHFSSSSSNDEDDFAIMRAKLAKKKQSLDGNDSEDDFDTMRAKLNGKNYRASVNVNSTHN